MTLDGMKWELVLANLRPHSDTYLQGFRRSCERQLDRADDDEGRIALAKFMLDAIDHILSERRSGYGPSDRSTTNG